MPASRRRVRLSVKRTGPTPSPTTPSAPKRSVIRRSSRYGSPSKARSHAQAYAAALQMIKALPSIQTPSEAAPSAKAKKAPTQSPGRGKSAYNQFVSKHMASPSMKDKSVTDRMRSIAQLWQKSKRKTSAKKT